MFHQSNFIHLKNRLTIIFILEFISDTAFGVIITLLIYSFDSFNISYYVIGNISIFLCSFSSSNNAIFNLNIIHYFFGFC